MKTKIGWIGLGKMGIPLSIRLINAGYPLTVYNRTQGKEELLVSKGAFVAASPSDLMKQSDMIVMMVSDDQAVRAIFSEPEGLLNSGASGKIIINMSTVSSGVSIEMAALCKLRGNHYLDAPVSGSVKQAESGALVVMTGGDEGIFEQAKPVLDELSKLAIYVGKTGSGNTMKLAVNLLLGIISQGLSEAVIFAGNHGLEISDLLNVIQNSAIGSVYMKIKGEAILQNNFQAAFALKHIAKDLRLAKDAGLNTPLGETALDSFGKAEFEFAEEDIIAILKAMKKSGV